ncbi:nucleotide exchange factor GrpE [Streptomyces sp. NPDC006283]|uniref:nucleotide exchange factor GrpE n=1 Tax=Streptomyces sp. NPDC006283 TaxID=3156741 RepID=UPI0033A8E76D
MSQEPDIRKDPDRRPPVVVRDRRRTDPVTLQPRRPTEPAGPPSKPNGPAQPEAAEMRRAHTEADELGPAQPEAAEMRRAQAEAAELRARNAELTADLQRLKAEYDNYRKRVRRDRLAIREIAVANVLAGLLPVLDAFEGARKHGADSGTGAVAEVLGERLAALGLQTVGAPGETFDPTVHEALTYHSSNRATHAVCTEVLRQGYRVGEHLLRPAEVSVTGPPAGSPGRGPGHGLGRTSDTAPAPDRSRLPDEGRPAST